MEELLQAALDAADRDGVLGVDVRLVSPQRYEHLAVLNGAASALTSSVRADLGVRVRRRRAWGFATTTVLTPGGAREVGRSALRAARAAETTRTGPLEVVEVEGEAGGSYATDLRIDPFAIPVEQKLSLLLEAERALHAGPAVKSGQVSFQAWREEKWFASSEGPAFRSVITHVGAGVAATAVSEGEVQRRSGPTSFGGDFRQGGWEFIVGLDLPATAQRVGREALELLTAPTAPSGTLPIVLASDQLALQVHESVGHATELDRILGFEAGYAGTSFLSPSDRGIRQYGSEGMTIVADATEPGGLGTFGWDDEGVRAQRTVLVDRGRLTGFLTSRETAATVGVERSGGTARAAGAYRMPLVRMTNVDLQPGDHTEEELLEGIQDGLYFETNRSWSIDDKRLNFQFGTEVGRRVRHGELAELVRNPIYSGMTPQFWASMDAVGNASTWHLWGVPNCGKGQPGQVARVGHGAPSARFQNVRVRGGA